MNSKTIDNLRWRYATKKFDRNKKLGEDQINILREAFNLTPTSYGLQPLTLVIVEDENRRKLLVEYAMGQRQVVEASHLLIICRHDKIDGEYIGRYFDRVQSIRKTPDDIIENFKTFLIKDFDAKDLDEVKHWAINQAYIALGNLLTVCAMERIDACPMEGFIKENIDDTLDLQSLGLRSVLLMPVGYRSSEDIFSGMKKVRKDLSESTIVL